jgi:hypothetical protein
MHKTLTLGLSSWVGSVRVAAGQLGDRVITSRDKLLSCS